MSASGVKYNKRKKIKLLLFIDYALQVKNNELIIGCSTKKIKITAANGKFFTYNLSSGSQKEYSRLKDLVNDIDLDILEHYNENIFKQYSTL